MRYYSGTQVLGCYWKLMNRRDAKFHSSNSRTEDIKIHLYVKNIKMKLLSNAIIRNSYSHKKKI